MRQLHGALIIALTSGLFTTHAMAASCPPKKYTATMAAVDPANIAEIGERNLSADGNLAQQITIESGLDKEPNMYMDDSGFLGLHLAATTLASAAKDKKLGEETKANLQELAKDRLQAFAQVFTEGLQKSKKGVEKNQRQVIDQDLVRIKASIKKLEKAIDSGDGKAVASAYNSLQEEMGMNLTLEEAEKKEMNRYLPTVRSRKAGGEWSSDIDVSELISTGEVPGEPQITAEKKPVAACPVKPSSLNGLKVATETRRFSYEAVPGGKSLTLPVAARGSPLAFSGAK